jgi:hypothetical protein
MQELNAAKGRFVPVGHYFVARRMTVLNFVSGSVAGYLDGRSNRHLVRMVFFWGVSQVVG